MRISVVIPVYDDAVLLRRHLPRGFDELIVVDASRDDPVREAELPADTILVRAGRAQRAGQMNLGARQATGEAIVFLHADTVLPEGAVEALRGALRDRAVAGGGFRRRFDHPSRILRWTCRLAAWRSCRFGWFLGDQAIFVRRAVFADLGGFAPLRAFEDVDLCRRMKRAGRLVCLDAEVVSSGRRFERGPLRRTLADLGLTLRYLVLGARAFADTE